MANFAPAICYEIIFSDSLTSDSEKGKKSPEYILTITNDAWFGKKSGMWQHLDMARRQAIETGLSVVRSNNAGVTAIIDPYGHIIASLPPQTFGVLDGQIPAGYKTIYRQIGLNGTMLLILVTVYGLITVLGIGRKRLF